MTGTVSVESVIATISAMELWFQGGKRWGKVWLEHPLNGRKCLMGAVMSVQATDGNRSWVPHAERAAAIECMKQAVRERGFAAVEEFNDTRMFYGEIAAAMNRARQIAMMTYARALPAPVEILPPPRLALAYQPEEEVVKLSFADLARVALPPPRR